MTNKTHILVIGNLGFALAISIGTFYQRVLFGSISDEEGREVIERAKYSFIDICIALTIFRTDLSILVVFLFTLLIFIKIFHWLAQIRVENIARLHINSTFSILRINFTLFNLLCIDLVLTSLFLYIIVQLNSFGVLILFCFEFSILYFNMCTYILRFIVLLIDQHFSNNWSWKFTILFAIEFFFDAIQLIIYIIFFYVISKNWSFPVHMLRELYFSFAQVQKRFQRFLRYRKLLKSLETEFPNVSKEKLKEQDSTCIICRGEMETGKQLPCRHIFHRNCLEQWFQEQPTCPTCRYDLFKRPNQRNNSSLDEKISSKIPNAYLKTSHLQNAISERSISKILKPQSLKKLIGNSPTWNKKILSVFKLSGENNVISQVKSNSQLFNTGSNSSVKYFPLPPGLVNISDNTILIQQTTHAVQSQMEYHRLITMSYKKLLDELINLQKCQLGKKF